jgi:iron complex outermembrane recepter protein
MRFRFSALSSAACIAVLAASGAHAQTAAGEAQASDADGGDIIVTASKREELLRDVPAAMTAISAETIETVGIQSFRDYASLTPGLSQRDFGSPGFGTVIIRGLNTGPQQTSNTAGFYFDDAPVGASGFLAISSVFTPEPDLGDVERIEVLKGPQGTLYGANSLGGLVRIVSRPPSFDGVSGFARGELTVIDGGGTGYSGRAAINFPISDTLAIRASGGYRRAPGFMTNLSTGTDNVNTSDIYGGRIALRFQPTPELTFDASAFIQNIDSVGSAAQQNRTDSTTPAFGRYQYRAYDDLPNEFRYRLYSGAVTYDFGPVSWITTGSFSSFQSNLNSDYTPSYIPLIRNFVPAGTIVGANTSPSTDKWTVETRLVSERLGAFEFIVGGFFTDENTVYNTVVPLLNGTTRNMLPAPFSFLLSSASLNDYREYAVFGNVTFYITDDFDATAGIRYGDIRNDITTRAPAAGQATALSFFAPVAPQFFSSSENPTNYLFNVRYRPTEQVSLFARAASGFRPGGPQTNLRPPPGAQTIIEADTVWNYEAGIKGDFLDQSLTLEASVYRIDWTDIQLNTLIGGSTLLGNGGNARIDGFELAFTARPSTALTISGSLGHTDGRIRSIDAAASATLGARAGDALPLTPKWTAAMLVDAQIPIGNDFALDLGATLRFQSGMPSSYAGSALNPLVRIPSYETVDLRLGFDLGAVRVQGRVENLFDTLGYTSISTGKLFPGQSVLSDATVIRPRSFVLSVSTDF